MFAQLWKNQQELAKSELNIDEQFAVLSRLVITNANVLRSRFNLMQSVLSLMLINQEHPMLKEEGLNIVKELVDGAMTAEGILNGPMLELLTYEQINKDFVAFAEFKKRPDFREHFRAWYMGEDVSKIPMPPPPPPAPTQAGSAELDEKLRAAVAAGDQTAIEAVVQEIEDAKAWREVNRQIELDELLAEFPKEEHEKVRKMMVDEGVTAAEIRAALQKVKSAAPAEPEPDFPEGAQVFGGDYKENDHGSSNGDRVEGEAEHGQAEAVPMSVVQEANANADQPRDAEA